MRTSVAFLTLFSLSALASEPSVFGAGDLNNPNPYGLTNEEKLILENRKEIQSVVKKHNVQTAKVETVAERLDGLQTIVEGLVETNSEHKLAIARLGEKNSDENTTVQIEALQKQVAANSDNIAKFQSLLEELSVVVDGINANYVSKEQFSALIAQLKVNVPAPKATSVSLKSDPASIEKEAARLFGEKKYAEAQVLYEQLINKKHKTAEAYYMIGETHFERKSYKEAVAAYKESAARNEKALYMPTLLLHSGISMEKNGDTATARAFYQATVSKYGGSGAAKEAQERLAKLK